MVNESITFNSSPRHKMYTTVYNTTFVVQTPETLEVKPYFFRNKKKPRGSFFNTLLLSRVKYIFFIRGWPIYNVYTLIVYFIFTVIKSIITEDINYAKTRSHYWKNEKITFPSGVIEYWSELLVIGFIEAEYSWYKILNYSEPDLRILTPVEININIKYTCFQWY